MPVMNALQVQYGLNPVVPILERNRIGKESVSKTDAGKTVVSSSLTLSASRVEEGKLRESSSIRSLHLGVE